MAEPITIERITKVESHPNSTNPMDVVTVESGRTNVANREEGAEARDKVGDYVIVIPEGYLLPENILRHNDLWNEEKGKGYLKGSKGNRTCLKNIADIPSEVMLIRGEYDPENVPEVFIIKNFNGGCDLVVPSNDLENELNVEKWVNPNK